MPFRAIPRHPIDNLREDIDTRYHAVVDAALAADPDLEAKRAVVARINRRLPGFHRIEAARGSQEQQKAGPYWIRDVNLNRINVDLERLALELSCLQPYEYLVA